MATVATPSSRQARMTRTAISPRLATRILRNTLVAAVGRVRASDAPGLRIVEICHPRHRTGEHLSRDAGGAELRQRARQRLAAGLRHLDRGAKLPKVVHALHVVRA